MVINRRALIAGAPLLLAAPGVARAQAYPSRPVRVIAPFPPGGALDAVSRKIAQKLSEQMGQQFFVENRTGATGTIGMGEAARSAPDGLTLLAMDSTYPMVGTVFRRLSWDHEHGFAGITDTAWSPSVLVVRADAPWPDLPAFLADARAHPEQRIYGSGGIGSVLHFFAEGLAQAARVKFFHVPYRGAGDAMTGLLSRAVEFSVAPTPATIEHVRGGTMRALALTGPRRSALLPQVPTFAEQGLPEFSPVYWTGLGAPAGTPAAIIARLQQEVARAMQADDMKAFLTAQVAEPGGSPTETYAKLVRDETVHWREVAAQAGIEPQ
ncbi:MAG TPA: tripartite tricarboxylate transporter substrate binding protein [Roseomonas sp.]|jgi:tripartite-type tricarboxylate transporter receptor subunit TctC